MTVDALDVRRAGLLYQAEDVLIQLVEPRVAPWLLQIAWAAAFTAWRPEPQSRLTV